MLITLVYTPLTNKVINSKHRDTREGLTRTKSMKWWGIWCWFSNEEDDSILGSLESRNGMFVNCVLHADVVYLFTGVTFYLYESCILHLTFSNIQTIYCNAQFTPTMLMRLRVSSCLAVWTKFATPWWLQLQVGQSISQQAWIVVNPIHTDDADATKLRNLSESAVYVIPYNKLHNEMALHWVSFYHLSTQLTTETTETSFLLIKLSVASNSSIQRSVKDSNGHTTFTRNRDTQTKCQDQPMTSNYLQWCADQTKIPINCFMSSEKFTKVE